MDITPLFIGSPNHIIGTKSEIEAIVAYIGAVLVPPPFFNRVSEIL